MWGNIKTPIDSYVIYNLFLIYSFPLNSLDLDLDYMLIHKNVLGIIISKGT